MNTINSAGILPIYNGKVYFLKDNKGKLCDFGGKIYSRRETPDHAAWREAHEEGGFDKTNCIKVINVLNNKSKHSIRVCEINKLPIAIEQNTSVVTMDYNDAWITKQLHFRVQSTSGLKKLLEDYKNSKRKRDEPVRPMFLDHVGPGNVHYKKPKRSGFEQFRSGKDDDDEVKVDPVEITMTAPVAGVNAEAKE